MFAPKKIRILSIIQLVILFTVLSFYLFKPGLDLYFKVEIEKLLIKEAGLGVEHPFPTFSFKEGFIAITHLSPWLKAYLLFSLIISLLFLLKIEGARKGLPILLVLLILGLFDRIYHAPSVPQSYEGALFPEEKVIVNDYLKKPLSGSGFAQRDQLLKGWQRYIIREWAQEEPSELQTPCIEQFKRGQVLFNLKRIEAIEKDRKATFVPNPSPLLFILLIIWTLFFTFKSGVKDRRQTQLHIQETQAN